MKALDRYPFFIRLFNWEYWNSTLIYAPLYLYWLWLSAKAKSVFFLTAANPSIRNGGFIMESKKDIYDQLPKGSYPNTCFFYSGTPCSQIIDILNSKQLFYPLIAKPDHGEKGLAVKKILNEKELMDYVERIPVNFLIQEFVAFEKEVGIFYYKIPGSHNGKISGIVDKHPVVVVGDGRSTIAELIQNVPRYILQLKQIKATYSTMTFKKVLKAGESFTLIAYGNHSRGSKFTNETRRNNPKLEQVIDRICSSMPQFYYGRLDIRFNTWEQLNEGINFSIIEVNGSGSEPTHIYDPNQSLFFAWREIIRHWNILFKICKANNEMGTPYLSFLTICKELNAFAEIDSKLSAQVW